MKVVVNNELVIIEDVLEPIPEVPKEMQIAELKQKLTDTDYVACKIAEGVATKEEYAEIIAQRQAWREEINKLESENA